MKKFLFAAIAATVSISAFAASYLTYGDTVRIKPNRLDGYYQHNITAHFDAYADNWQMAVTFPDGLTPKLVAGITPLSGMSVGYVDRDGAFQVYEAPLRVSAAYATIGSSISVDGYWDYNMDGVFESYGTAKWSAGDYEMFSLNLYVSPEFRKGWLIFDGTIDSGTDRRGPILANVMFYSRTWVWVGYMPGDVSGNERFSIDDVTMLIDYLLGMPGDLDEFQIAACDANQDGNTNIADVTCIIDKILMN